MSGAERKARLSGTGVVARLTEAECAGDGNGSPLVLIHLRGIGSLRGPFGMAMIRGGSRSAKFHTKIDGDAIRIMSRADVIKVRRPSGREQLRVRNH